MRLPPGRRLRALRHGFTALSWVLYELDRNDPAVYLPDYVDIDYRHQAPYRMALGDKLTFALLMRAAGVASPEPLAFVERGRILALDGTASERDVGELLLEHPRLVVKYVDGAGGRHVHFVESSDEGAFVDGRPVALGDIRRWLTGLDAFLITPFVEQAAVSRDLHPSSTNTVRILTLWDHDLGEPFLAAAAQRVGRGTRATDNFKSGMAGLSCPIDPHTGRLGRGACFNAQRDGVERHATHPDTGADLEGRTVPAWQRTVDAVLRAASTLPHCPYVGWDLVPTDDGPVLLEANSPPGTFVWQVHGGLLREPRARRAFGALGFV